MANRTAPLGRRWTVRLDPYGRPAAGVSLIHCVGEACVPDTARYRDPVLARAKARQHVLEHIGRIQGLREGAVCRCRHEECAWHPHADTTCTRQIVLVLIADQVGRVWNLAEVCSACATAVPRAQLVRGQVPAIPAGQPPTDRPAGLGAGARRRRALEAVRQRAMDCPLCAVTHPPTADALAEAPGGSYASTYGTPKNLAVPPQFGVHLLSILRYLESGRVGRSPDARLLAALVTLRIRPSGTVYLVEEDFEAGRFDLPHAAAQDLIDSGWLTADLEEITGSARRGEAAPGRVGDLPAGSAQFGIPKGQRSRMCGWLQRVIAHPLLAGQPAAERLAAGFVLTLAGRTGRAAVIPQHLARLCAIGDAPAATAALESLHEAGWLTGVDKDPTGRTRLAVTLDPTVWQLIPGAEPDRPTSIEVTGLGYQIAAWVDAYLARHNHGPRHRELLAAHCPQSPTAPWTDQQIHLAVAQLAREGWIHISNSRWYRTRPGPAYLHQLAREQGTAAPAPAPVAMPPRPRRSGLWLIPGADAILGPPPDQPPSRTVAPS